MIYMITGETIKGGSRETKGQKRTGGGRTGYGKREIVTPLSPPLFIKKLLYLFLVTSFPLVLLFTFITGSICPFHRIITKPIKKFPTLELSNHLVVNE